MGSNLSRAAAALALLAFSAVAHADPNDIIWESASFTGGENCCLPGPMISVSGASVDIPDVGRLELQQPTQPLAGKLSASFLLKVKSQPVKGSPARVALSYLIDKTLNTKIRVTVHAGKLVKTRLFGAKMALSDQFDSVLFPAVTGNALPITITLAAERTDTAPTVAFAAITINGINVWGAREAKSAPP